MVKHKYVKLGEIVEKIIDYRGVTPTKRGGEWADSGIRALSALNVKTRSLVALDKVRFVNENLYKAWMKDEIQRGDILITSEAPFGEVFFWDSDEKIVLSQRLYGVRLKKCVNSAYVFQYMTSSAFQGELHARATGSTVEGLRQPALLKCLVFIPPIKTQDKIASILSAYDNLIEVNNKRIKVLEQEVENLYKEWFIRFRFPGYKSAEFDNGIPNGWKSICAVDAIDFNPTLNTGNQSEFTMIPMEALSTTSMVLDSRCFERKNSISGRRSQNGDTLLAKITPCLENGKTGFVMGMPDKEVLGGSTEFVVMRSKTLTPHYVYCFARSQYFRQTAILSMNGADGRQRVDEDKLKSTKTFQPKKSVLDRFEAIVTPIFNCVYQLVQENQNLITQRDLLLPRLMSGKLEV